MFGCCSSQMCHGNQRSRCFICLSVACCWQHVGGIPLGCGWYLLPPPVVLPSVYRRVPKTIDNLLISALCWSSLDVCLPIHLCLLFFSIVSQLIFTIFDHIVYKVCSLWPNLVYSMTSQFLIIQSVYIYIIYIYIWYIYIYMGKSPFFSWDNSQIVYENSPFQWILTRCPASLRKRRSRASPGAALASAPSPRPPRPLRRHQTWDLGLAMEIWMDWWYDHVVSLTM